MSNWVNCNAPHRFQADGRVPNSRGDLATPVTPGELAGLVLRLSDSDDGAAIHSDLGNLPTQETVDQIGRIYHEVSALLLQTHILPLGVGQPFWSIWSIPGVMGLFVHRHRITDHTRI